MQMCHTAFYRLFLYVKVLLILQQQQHCVISVIIEIVAIFLSLSGFILFPSCILKSFK